MNFNLDFIVIVLMITDQNWDRFLILKSQYCQFYDDIF